jgi:hypothetical protein
MRPIIELSYCEREVLVWETASHEKRFFQYNTEPLLSFQIVGNPELKIVLLVRVHNVVAGE